MQVRAAFSWQPEPDATGYRLYVDGARLAETFGVSHQANLDLSLGDHIFAIRAFNASGEGPPADVRATVEDPDTEPEPVPEPPPVPIPGQVRGFDVVLTYAYAQPPDPPAAAVDTWLERMIEPFYDGEALQLIYSEDFDYTDIDEWYDFNENPYVYFSTGYTNDQLDLVADSVLSGKCLRFDYPPNLGQASRTVQLSWGPVDSKNSINHPPWPINIDGFYTCRAIRGSFVDFPYTASGGGQPTPKLEIMDRPATSSGEREINLMHWNTNQVLTATYHLGTGNGQPGGLQNLFVPMVTPNTFPSTDSRVQNAIDLDPLAAALDPQVNTMDEYRARHGPFVSDATTIDQGDVDDGSFRISTSSYASQIPPPVSKNAGMALLGVDPNGSDDTWNIITIYVNTVENVIYIWGSHLGSNAVLSRPRLLMVGPKSGHTLHVNNYHGTQHVPQISGVDDVAAPNPPTTFLDHRFYTVSHLPMRHPTGSTDPSGGILPLPTPPYIESAIPNAFDTATFATVRNGNEKMMDIIPADWLASNQGGPPGGTGPLYGVLSGFTGAAKATSGYRLYLGPGGGHSDGALNGDWPFDVSGIDMPHGWLKLNASDVADVTVNTEPYVNGYPSARHTYDSVIYAHHNHHLYTFWGNIFGNASGIRNVIWKLNCATGEWTKIEDISGFTGSNHGKTVYDPVTRKILYTGTQKTFGKFLRCDDDTSSATKSFPDGFQTGTHSGFCGGLRRLGNGLIEVVHFGRLSGGDPTRNMWLVTIDFENETIESAEEITPTGDISNDTWSTSNEGVSHVYDPRLDCWWYWGGTAVVGGDSPISNIYRFERDFSVSAEALGTALQTEHCWGSFGRYLALLGEQDESGNYMPSCDAADWRTIFTVNSINSPAQAIRLPTA